MYIESVLAENICMDLITGLLSTRMLHVRVCSVRLFFCVVAGATLGVLFPLLPPWPWLTVLFKLACVLLAAAILFAGRISFLRGLLAYVCAVFLFGGLLLALRLLCFKDASAALEQPLLIFMPLFLLASAALYAILRRFVLTLGRRRLLASRLYRYSFSLCGQTLEGNGLLDTGNTLFDPRTGLPVVVLHVGAVLPLLCDADAAQLLTGHVERVLGARPLQVQGAGGAGKLWLLPAQTFSVYFDKDEHKVYDVMVGLSFTLPKGGKDYNAILHPAMLAADKQGGNL